VEHTTSYYKKKSKLRRNMAVQVEGMIKAKLAFANILRRYLAGNFSIFRYHILKT